MDKLRRAEVAAREKLRIVHVQRDEHSQAFSDVCELLLASLLDLGYDVDLSPKLSGSRRNIVVGANQLGERIPVGINYTVLQLEQLRGDWWGGPHSEIFANASEILDYDPANIGLLDKFGFSAKQLTIGHHKSLNRITPQHKRIDVLHYGSLNDRRRKVLAQCEALGLNVQQVFGVYGHDRDQLIAQSKIVLNVHFYPEQIFEQARVSYLLNNGVTVVSENSTYDPYFNVPFIRSSYERLAETCKAAVEQNCSGEAARQEFANKHSMVRIMKELMA